VRRQERERAERLAQLLDDGARPDNAPADLRGLVSLAATVTDHRETLHPAVAPSPEFRAALRERLVAETIPAPAPTVIDRTRDAIAARTASWRNSAKLAIASATASTLVGTAGVAAAAQHALPGDALYGIKRATETVRTALASGYDSTGQVNLALARERLDEVVVGAGSVSPELLIETLDAMDERSSAGVSDLLAFFEETQDPAVLRTIAAFTEEQRQILTAALGDLPIEIVPRAESSLELLTTFASGVRAAAAGCDCVDMGDAADAGLDVAEMIGQMCECGATDATGATSDRARERQRGESRDEGSTSTGGQDSGSTAADPNNAGGDTLDSGGDSPLLSERSSGGVPTDDLEDGVREAGDAVGDTVDSTTDGVGDAVDTVTRSGASSGSDPVDGVVEDTTKAVEKTKKTVEDTTESVVDGLTDGLGG
jgi:hypothetical protein